MQAAIPSPERADDRIGGRLNFALGTPNDTVQFTCERR
jgi:hypothetical protein